MPFKQTFEAGVLYNTGARDMLDVSTADLDLEESIVPMLLLLGVTCFTSVLLEVDCFPLFVLLAECCRSSTLLSAGCFSSLILTLECVSSILLEVGHPLASLPLVFN